METGRRRARGKKRRGGRRYGEGENTKEEETGRKGAGGRADRKESGDWEKREAERKGQGEVSFEENFFGKVHSFSSSIYIRSA